MSDQDKTMQEPKDELFPVDVVQGDHEIAMGINDALEPKTPQPEENNQQDEPVAPPEEPDSIPEEPVIDIGGEKVPLSKIQEWRSGYLRQDDYTRKTQTLAQQRKEIEQLEQQLKPFLQLDAYLRSNPQAAQRFAKALQSLPPEAMGMGAAPPQTFMSQQMYQQLSETQRQLQELKLDRELEMLRHQVNQERREYGLSDLTDDEWQNVSNRIMQEAVDARVQDLNAAYRMSSVRSEWHRQAVELARQKALEDQRQRSKQVSNAVMRGSLSGGPLPESPENHAKTLQEATRRAFQELRASGISLYR